jgi:hypothetical protein
MHDVTELVRAIAWPTTLLVVLFVLRPDFQLIIKNIANRVRSAESLRIGPRGIEFKGLIRAPPLAAEVQVRKVALSRYIREVSDKARLDRIADALDLARSTDARVQRNDIILEINRLVASSQDMDSLSGKILGVTGRGF